MPYQVLYARRQASVSRFLPLEWYVSDAMELAWVNSIAIEELTVLDPEILRGLIITYPCGKDHGLTWDYKIYVSANMESHEKRFVALKELMHIYRPEKAESTSTALGLENHLRQFFGKSGSTPSLGVMAEYKALWMARGVICPERDRLEMQKNFEDDHKIVSDFASQLQVPSKHVQSLFTAQYDDEIRDLFS